MFENLFAKYARAISDENKRRELYAMYRLKIISLAIFLVLSIAMLVETFVFDPITDPKLLDIAFAVFGVTMLLWLVSAAVWLVCAIKFRLRYRAILNAPASAGEMPEVVSYRAKVRAGRKLTKPVIAGIIALVAGGAFLIFAIFYDTFTSPDSQELGFLTNIAIYIFAVCFAAFLLLIFFSEYSKASAGRTTEMQTESESAAIDAASGRVHRYSLKSDKNAQSYRYLFPDESLRGEAEVVKARMQKFTTIAAMSSAIASLVLCGVLFAPFICAFEWSGYSVPIVITVITIAVVCAVIPFVKSLKRLEEEQKLQLESNPDFSLNLQIYRLYEAYSKGKGRVIYIFYALAAVLSYVLAALFPRTMLSLVGIIPLFIGIALNYVFVSQLRKSCLPIEEQIDKKAREEVVADGEDGEAEE